MDETHRHRCEVRHCIRLGMEDKDRVYGYVVRVKKKRGEPAGEQLLRDSREQYRRGNRGQFGVWIEL